MSRTGKIARLPFALREQINIRLLSGEPAAKILPWLNNLAEVQAALGEDFEGLAVNDENLSKWRKGGYQEWLSRRDRAAHTKELADISHQLAKANGGSISEGAAAIASGQILETLEQLDDLMKLDQSDPSDPSAQDPVKRFARMQEIAEAITGLTLAIDRMRKGDQTAEALRLTRDRLAQAQQTIDLERSKFDQRLAEYRDKVAEQKRALQSELIQVRTGGLTPEALKRIEEAVSIL